MSDLFRSALGYLSGPSQGGQGGAGSQGGGVNGGYSSASGGPSDETNAVGEVVQFTHNGQRSKQVRITKLIAEGGFSYVFKGIDLQNGEAIAVKKMLAPDQEARKAVAQEKEFMSQFQHENIARYFGAFVKSGGKNLEEHYLAMEYCPVQLPTPPLRIQHTTQVFAQVCRAIKYLHDFGIVHRDIKLENVLIGADGLVKLVDFGSATMEKFYPAPDWSMNKRTIVEEQIAAKTTPMYRAPEMLDLWSNYAIDEHVDLWALGCLLFALNFGQHPFQDSNKLAIVNANYSLPKNVSDSGPIVTLIRGLLKVDPVDRLTFGQIFEVLISIAESQGFSPNAPLPFKAPSSPNTTGGGIVNPLAAENAPPTVPIHHHHHHHQHSSSSGGGGSLFSSLKGGAASLIKNIKEQSQQYLAPVVPPSSGGGNSAPPPRPAPPSAAAPQPSRVPPSRPPPSPLMNQRKGDKEQIEFENREYDAMNQSSAAGPVSRSAPPRPARPPTPPKVEAKPAPNVANLLDMSFDAGPSLEPVAANSGGNSNADLLEDLFGAPTAPAATAPNNLSQDLFWGSGSGSNNEIKQSDVEDLLCDPVASLLGKSAPTTMSMPQKPVQGFAANFGASQPQPFLQPTQTMPQSASFQNLNAHGFSGNGASLLDTGKIPKNSSSPNLHDLILGDIMSTAAGGGGNTIGGSSGGGSSNPTLSNQQANNGKPNYNRTQIFDPPAPEKKQNLNDVFGDILNSQGFATNRLDGGRTINEMRKVEMLANPNMNPTQIKVNEWREGKKKNIRALLSSLHTITWDSCHWEETNMSQMITPAQVKKTYRKACLAIHPDKQMGEEWEELAKMIFVELNEAWAAFEESQQ